MQKKREREIKALAGAEDEGGRLAPYPLIISLISLHYPLGLMGLNILIGIIIKIPQ